MIALVPVTVQHDGRAWPLWRQDGSTEPLAKDLDVARWLEFGRPHEIRRLIDRNSVDLGDLFVTATKSHGRPGRAYYLTEAQALFLAAKSETPKATQVLKAMIAVFLLARGSDHDAQEQGIAELRAVVREELAAAMLPVISAIQDAARGIRLFAERMPVYQQRQRRPREAAPEQGDLPFGHPMPDMELYRRIRDLEQRDEPLLTPAQLAVKFGCTRSALEQRFQSKRWQWLLALAKGSPRRWRWSEVAKALRMHPHCMHAAGETQGNA